MLDVQNGTLHLPSGMALTPDTGPDSPALKDFKEFAEVNGFYLMSAPSLILWGKKFSLTLRFKGGKLQFIEMIWNDGQVSRLGYDASQNDLLSEKGQLVKMLTKHLGSAPADTSLGADYFPYPWGVVIARADLKSTMCSVVIDYVQRARGQQQ